MEKSQTLVGALPQIYILYASQTGNCEQISEDFHAELSKTYPSCKRFLMNDHQAIKNQKVLYDLSEKDALKLCIFICSSTGNGDFPDNGENFHKYLRRLTVHLEEGEETTILSHVWYTILGLGDTNYSKYQGAPRYLDEKMKQLGAQKFYERGEADEATSLELVIEPWLEGVYPAIAQTVKKIKSQGQSQIKDLLKPVFYNETHEVSKEFENKDEIKKAPIITHGHLTLGEVFSLSLNKEVILAKLKVDKPISMDFIDAGSSFSLFPHNKQEDIDFVIDQFKWNRTALIGNNTIEELLRTEIDIVSEKIKLSKFLSEYDLKFLQKDLLEHPYLTLKEFAKNPPSTFEIPNSILEDDLPKIKPRYYSIINDPFYDKDQKELKEKGDIFEICLSTHNFEKNGEAKRGLASGFLKDLITADDTKTSFKLQFSQSNKIIFMPNIQYFEHKRPIVMICHGTGVAPFISLLRRIENLIDKYEQVGTVLMFYGIRNDHSDFLFKDEILRVFGKLSTKTEGSQLYVSCSREIEDIEPSQYMVEFGYVQDYFDSIEVRKKVRHNVFDKEGYIMICGNKNSLGASVQNKLVQHNQQVFTKEEITNFKRETRMLLELWSE
eukprot:403374487